MSIGMRNTTDSIFCVLLLLALAFHFSHSFRLYHFRRLLLLLLLLVAMSLLCYHLQYVVHERQSLATTVCAGNLDIHSICCSGISSVLPRQMECFPNNCSKNANQPMLNLGLVKSSKQIKKFNWLFFHIPHDTHKSRTLASSNVDRKIIL